MSGEMASVRGVHGINAHGSNIIFSILNQESITEKLKMRKEEDIAEFIIFFY